MKSKKKILIFSLAYFPKHVGGAEVAIKEITNRISPDEYEFHMICNRYDSTLPKTEKVGNVMVYRIGIVTKEPSMADLRKMPLHLNKFLFQFLAFKEARKLHKVHHYDGIWAMMAHACGVPAGLFKKAFPDVPYLLTLQEGDKPEDIEKKMRVFGKNFPNAFRKADTIQVISTFLGKWAIRMGYTGEPVLVPNAVNTKHFSQIYSKDDIQNVKDELGKKEGEIWLVTTSRLVHKNAVDDVIRAIAELPENIHFLIFGTGPDGEMLKQLSKDLKIEDRIHFYGHIDHSVMPKYLKACDIFIRPSRSEGMGNSFVEAMAAKLPVIATQEGGIADFLFDAKKNPDKESTGWAVDPDSPTQIAAAVQDIVQNPDNTQKVCGRAYQMALEKYDWDLIAQRMKTEVFDKLVKTE